MAGREVAEPLAVAPMGGDEFGALEAAVRAAVSAGLVELFVEPPIVLLVLLLLLELEGVAAAAAAAVPLAVDAGELELVVAGVDGGMLLVLLDDLRFEPTKFLRRFMDDM